MDFGTLKIFINLQDFSDTGMHIFSFKSLDSLSVLCMTVSQLQIFQPVCWFLSSDKVSLHTLLGVDNETNFARSNALEVCEIQLRVFQKAEKFICWQNKNFELISLLSRVLWILHFESKSFSIRVFFISGLCLVITWIQFWRFVKLSGQ